MWEPEDGHFVVDSKVKGCGFVGIGGEVVEEAWVEEAWEEESLDWELD